MFIGALFIKAENSNKVTNRGNDEINYSTFTPRDYGTAIKNNGLELCYLTKRILWGIID